MNRPALVETIRILRTVPQELFDMGRFATPTVCGTIGCIAGHCAMDLWFQKQGFKLSEDRPYIPEYGENIGYYAIIHFFDLSLEQSSRIFYATRSETPTPQAAIEVIERLLAQ